MLKPSKEYLEKFLTMSWGWYCSHYFIDYHDNLSNAQVDATNSAVRTKAKNNSTFIHIMRNPHLVQYYQSILLLEILQLSVGEIIESKCESINGQKYCVQMNESVFI